MSTPIQPHLPTSASVPAQSVSAPAGPQGNAPAVDPQVLKSASQPQSGAIEQGALNKMTKSLGSFVKGLD